MRGIVKVLGGQLIAYPLIPPEYAVSEAEMNHGLPPYGDEVNNSVTISLGNRVWRAYLTPVAGGTTMLPLRQLALALGFTLSWDGTGAVADLQPVM